MKKPKRAQTSPVVLLTDRQLADVKGGGIATSPGQNQSNPHQ